MNDQPLTHIARTPLPWREVGRTICGQPIATGGAWGKREPIVEHELRAIAALIAAHPAEFAELVASYAAGDVVSLAEHRRSRPQ